ncbi:NAD-dependent DNA ligase LigA [Desulfogranum marinum]|uniref:NAD-dependent DNA ligase LigA n=1 Tax=Desulfogranum marinum TaxID=453220 RepID=UPI0029C8EC47|nr:NAD-dependent DNA ligase LigA [Desulfogranum marinum]
MTSDVKKRIEELRQQLHAHGHRYYVLDDPVISDGEYDRLFQELLHLEAQYPESITADSPTQRVGGKPLKGFKTAEHIYPMLSLDNIFSRQGLLDFEEKLKRYLKGDTVLEYITEPKLDGLAVELVYENDRLVTGSTRGNGLIGEDVTEQLKTVPTIPLRLLATGEVAIPRQLIVRGEVFLPKKGFKQLNQRRKEEGLSLFANPRNAAAGSLRQLDPKVTAQRPLHFYAYSVATTEGVQCNTQFDLLAYLRSLGFAVSPLVCHCKSVDDVGGQFDLLVRKRHGLDYEIDGMVVKVNRFSLQQRFGNTARAPRWAVAWKFPAVQASTIIERVEFQVGRTGVVTPVAHLQPVEVDGAIVRRATLHNRDEVNKKDLRLHDTVLVQRAGDVIPEVVKAVVENRTGKEEAIVFPERCPECDGQLEQGVGEAAIRCTNLLCPAQKIQRLIYFAGKSGLDIEGLGKKHVEQLYSAGLIEDIADFFLLKKDQLILLDGWGEKSAQGVIQSIDKVKAPPLNTFIRALGIRYVGEVTAELIAGHYESLDELVQSEASELMAIEGVGPQVAESLVTFLRSEPFAKLLIKLDQAGVVVQAAGKSARPLDGRIFVFTGSLNHMTRNEAKQLVKSLGGKVVSSISGKVTDVVAGERAGGKLEKAQKLGLGLLAEEAFVGLIRDLQGR